MPATLHSATRWCACRSPCASPKGAVRTRRASTPAAATGLALRNLAPKSRSIGERYIENHRCTHEYLTGQKYPVCIAPEHLTVLIISIDPCWPRILEQLFLKNN
jgi:hypothetical protein